MAASISLLRGKVRSPRSSRGRLVGRGHKHPHGKNQVLRNGPKLRETGNCHVAQFLGPRPDVHGPPFRRALAFLGFWVRRLLQAARQNRHRVSLLACQTESRRSKGHLQERQGGLHGRWWSSVARDAAGVSVSRRSLENVPTARTRKMALRWPLPTDALPAVADTGQGLETLVSRAGWRAGYLCQLAQGVRMGRAYGKNVGLKGEL
jgi:hypothetical protein